MPAKKRFAEVLRDVFTELGAFDNIAGHHGQFAPIVACRWKELDTKPARSTPKSVTSFKTIGPAARHGKSERQTGVDGPTGSSITVRGDGPCVQERASQTNY